MAQLSVSAIHYGSDEPLPKQINLRAGPLSMVYEAGALRYIRLGKTEVLHQIYSAVRDHNWGTIMPQLSAVQMDIQADSFRIRYTSQHCQNDIDFVWTGKITGGRDGTVVFDMDGEARSTFQRNRIGFCILHPMNCAGLPCTVEQVNGKRSEGKFPLHISPHQPFKDIRAITHEALPGVKVEVRMEGETFEMEDQRNWTDASYKTYCTPLVLPFPVTVEKGTKIRQTITVRLIGHAASVQVTDERQMFQVEDRAIGALPALGLGCATHGQPLTERETERLRALNLAHLRVDLRLNHPGASDILRRAAGEARTLGVSLEAALHLSDNAESDLQALRALLNGVEPPVVRWAVFHQNERSTTAKWVTLARRCLGDCDDAIAFGAGTDAFFPELNRARPPVDAVDFVTYSLNPQVHAFDNASLVETLAVQAVTVETARQFCGGKPILVSPVTLKMRWNPSATAPRPEPAPGELPPQVDPRQMSLFGAGWTLGSVKYLAESGVYSATYYETTGWLGVMETVQGSSAPDKFRSIPGGVFPLYHALADIGQFAGAGVLGGASSEILKVDGLVLRQNGALRILLASFAPKPQTVIVKGAAGTFTLKSLDETTALDAMREPERYRAQSGQRLQLDPAGTGINLLPYAVVTLDRSE